MKVAESFEAEVWRGWFRFVLFNVFNEPEEGRTRKMP
jgi:hypothetical protein